MSYTTRDTRDIFYGDHEDFEQEPVHESEGNESRWSMWSTRIYRNKKTGEHWSVTVGRGLTEYQDDEIYDPPQRVELREVTASSKTVSVELPVGTGILHSLLNQKAITSKPSAFAGSLKSGF